jgi:hypothetical protein
MADQKISAMNSAGALTGAEIIPVVQGGANVRTTLADAVAYGNALVTLSSLGASANGITLIGHTFAQMRADLDLEAGTDFYSISAADTAIAAAVTTHVGLSDPHTQYLLESSVSANGLTLIGHTFAQMRTDLGLVIGTNVQAWDADLDSWAAVTRASGFDAFCATPSSANLKTLVTDETGSGALVFADTPTLVTPILGTPTSGNLANCTGLPATALTGAVAVANGGTGVAATAGAIIVNFYANGVDFNSANTDTVIPIQLPSGYTRFLVQAARISGANGTLTSVTCGLFTASGGGGVAIVSSGTAVTVNTASENTNGNTQNLTVNNSVSQSYRLVDVPNLYFRVQNPQGAARTGTVFVQITPVP